jgi:hypothetical protein
MVRWRDALAAHSGALAAFARSNAWWKSSAARSKQALYSSTRPSMFVDRICSTSAVNGLSISLITSLYLPCRRALLASPYTAPDPIGVSSSAMEAK